MTTTEGARTRRGLKIAEIWSLESFPMVLQCWSVVLCLDRQKWWAKARFILVWGRTFHEEGFS